MIVLCHQYVSYHSRDVITRNRPVPVDFKLDLRIGRVKAVYLHRFTTELIVRVYQLLLSTFIILKFMSFSCIVCHSLYKEHS